MVFERLGISAAGRLALGHFGRHSAGLTNENQTLQTAQSPKKLFQPFKVAMGSSLEKLGRRYSGQEIHGVPVTAVYLHNSHFSETRENRALSSIVKNLHGDTMEPCDKEISTNF